MLFNEVNLKKILMYEFYKIFLTTECELKLKVKKIIC